MRNKNSKGRTKLRPSHLKIIAVLFLSILVAVFTYVGLEYFYKVDKKTSHSIIEQPTKEQPLHEKNETAIKFEYKFKPKNENINKIFELNTTVLSPTEPIVIKPPELNASLVDENPIKTQIPAPPKVKIFSQKRPKLAIIIDDVSTFAQQKEIKQSGLKLTPSIFPPTKIHPKTPQIAKNFDYYMIHLPLWATNYSRPESGTLMTTDSYEKIYSTLVFIKENFPKAQFINNHTGSAFTANLDSMNMLIRACDELGFGFIDSKTTNESKVGVAAKNHGHRYVWRDVFLDNVNSVPQIRKQLSEAVKIAKKRGFAIAIGHPKSLTIKTIVASGDILKDVDVVYLKDIYEYYK